MHSHTLAAAFEFVKFARSRRCPRREASDLKVINRGPRPALIVDGEELLGAKQNRVVNLTILVPAFAELTIPVSYIKPGRWRARSRSFRASPRTQHASGRAKRIAHVSLSMAARGDRVRTKWTCGRTSRPCPASRSGAGHDRDGGHLHGARSLESFVAVMHPVEGQIGDAIAIGSRVAGFDLFDRPSTLNRLLPKLGEDAADCAADRWATAAATLTRSSTSALFAL